MTTLRDQFLMNGILYWNKRYINTSWWSSTNYGGNLYYRIPYRRLHGGILDMKHIKKIVTKLFKKNPDFCNCYIEMASVYNKGTTDEYVTAIVVTSDKMFYDKYTEIDLNSPVITIT